MRFRKLYTVCLLVALLATGCTHVNIVKPDGTIVDIFTVGSTQLEALSYLKDPCSVSLRMNGAANTPKDMDKLIAAVGKAFAEFSTAGASTALINLMPSGDTNEVP